MANNEVADKPKAHDAVQTQNAASLSRSTTDLAHNSTTPRAELPNVVNHDGTMNFGSNLYNGEATVAAAARPGAPAPADVAKPGEALAKPSDTLATGVNAAEIAQSKQRLEGAIPPDKMKDFQKEMDTIEHRNPPLDAKQINAIYDKTTELLTDPNKTSQLDQTQRTQLADSMLHDIGHPNETDQGMHNTCNVTALEKRLNATDPTKFANMVTEVGLTGHYTASDGKVIQVAFDKNSLKPDAEASLDPNDKRTDGARNYASQIFDLATVNDYWQHQNPPLQYKQVAPASPNDTGERLTYPNGQEVMGPDGKPMRQPGLSTEAIGQIGKDLGMKDNFIISNAEVDGPNSRNGVDKVQDFDAFKKQLENMKPPAIIMVNAGNHLFTNASTNNQSDGWHVVNATDYKAGPPAMVFMTNQWGSENNKWVPVTDLYNATLSNSSHSQVDANGQLKGAQQEGGQQGGERQQGGGQQQGDGGNNGGGNGGQGGQGGWNHSGSEVFRDDEYKQWRQQVFDKYWNTQDPNNPLLKPENQVPGQKVDPMVQIQPLQAMLDAARKSGDELQTSILENQINSIRSQH